MIHSLPSFVSSRQRSESRASLVLSNVYIDSGDCWAKAKKMENCQHSLADLNAWGLDSYAGRANSSSRRQRGCVVSDLGSLTLINLLSCSSGLFEVDSSEDFGLLPNSLPMNDDMVVVCKNLGR